MSLPWAVRLSRASWVVDGRLMGPRGTERKERGAVSVSAEMSVCLMSEREREPWVEVVKPGASHSAATAIVHRAQALAVSTVGDGQPRPRHRESWPTGLQGCECMGRTDPVQQYGCVNGAYSKGSMIALQFAYCPSPSSRPALPPADLHSFDDDGPTPCRQPFSSARTRLSSRSHTTRTRTHTDPDQFVAAPSP